MIELKRLLTVKSITTLLLTVIFAILLLMGRQIPQEFTMMYSTVICFYFGTQSERLNQKIETKTEKKSANKIKVIYTKSCIGYNKNQAKVLESLGLKKLHDSNVLPDNPAVRGMIFKVRHLVSVENA